MRNFVISASALALAAGCALGAKPEPKYLDRLADVAHGASGGGERNYNSNGFEAPGFALGAMPQGGWTTLGTLVPGLGNGGSISNANPAAGAQHLRTSKDPAFGNGYYNGSLYNVNKTTGPVTTTVKTYIPAGAYADYYFFGMRSDAYFAWGVHMTFTGTITNAFSGGTTIGNIIYGQYVDLSVSYNNGTETITYNGATLYSGATGFTVNQYDYVWCGSDNWQLSGENADWDNLTVSPAPGAAGLLGLGALAGLRRRR